MDDACLETQRVVSETYDGAHVDPADIQRARMHCTSCDECAAFVSALAEVRRLRDPAAPESVINSAFAKVAEERRRVEAQAATQAAAAAEAEAAARETTGAAEGGAAMAPLFRWLSERLERMPRWAVYAGYAAGGVAALFVVGVVMLQGARYIARPQESATDQDVFYVSPQGAGTAESGAPEDESSNEDRAAEADVAAESAAYVTVGQWVYEFVGIEDSQPANTGKIGTTTSALDTSSAPRTLDVLAFGDPESVLIVDGERILRFELVTRSYRGKAYAMQSRAVSAFDQWPSLPDSYLEPEQDDGSPTFSRVGSDDSRVPIYTVEGADPLENGFAIGPDTAADDPAAGNPNWTWWEPVP